MPELTITIPGPLWFTSNNLRGSHHIWAPKIRGLRALGKSEAIAANLPRFDVVALAVFVGYPTAGRADPPNVAGTVSKALIDGFVDAGVIPDDDSRHIVATTFLREKRKAPKGTHTMRFVFTDQVIPWLEPTTETETAA